MDITINNTTQSSEEWEIALSKAVDTGWFDTIDRHLRANGIWIEHPLAKKKACHVRMAKSSVFFPYGLLSQRYKEDFGESMPLHVDGKDWRAFI